MPIAPPAAVKRVPFSLSRHGPMQITFRTDRSKSSVLMLLFTLAGCSTAQMQLPAGLSAADRMSVQGRQGWKINQRIRFGPYKAYDVDRSWTRGRNREIFPVSRSRRTQDYSFVVRNGTQDEWRVNCRAYVSARSIDVIIGKMEETNRSSLDCTLASLTDPDDIWALELRERGERPLAGYLENADVRLDVRGVDDYKQGAGCCATTGYHITDEEGRVLGAVETINDGAVWLTPGTQPDRRSVLAGTASALLLLENLREMIQDS